MNPLMVFIAMAVVLLVLFSSRLVVGIAVVAVYFLFFGAGAPLAYIVRGWV